MGRPDMAPQTPRRSERPGEAVALLDTPRGSWLAAEGTAAGAAEARVEHVAKRVAEHVEAEHGERDGGPREERHPRRVVHERPARARQHAGPGRVRRPEPEGEGRQAPPRAQRRPPADCPAENYSARHISQEGTAGGEEM